MQASSCSLASFVSAFSCILYFISALSCSLASLKAAMKEASEQDKDEMKKERLHESAEIKVAREQDNSSMNTK